MPVAKPVAIGGVPVPSLGVTTPISSPTAPKPDRYNRPSCPNAIPAGAQGQFMRATTTPVWLAPPFAETFTIEHPVAALPRCGTYRFPFLSSVSPSTAIGLWNTVVQVFGDELPLP